MTSSPRFGLIAVVCAFMPGPGSADPMEDICHLRAKDLSGYSGASLAPKKGGGVSAQLSGSATFGLSVQNNVKSPGSNSPAFAGAASTARREQDAIRRYQRIYDDCMISR